MNTLQNSSTKASAPTASSTHFQERNGSFIRSNFVNAALVFSVATTTQVFAKQEAFVKVEHPTARTFSLDKPYEKRKQEFLIEVEAQKWIASNGALNDFLALISLVRFFAENTPIHVSVFTDPEEDWSKLSIELASGFGENYELRFALEDKILEALEQSSRFDTLLQKVIISQV